MLKAVHIHTDLKFVDGVRFFAETHFDNEVIIVGKTKTYSNPHIAKDRVKLFSDNRHDFRQIVQICNSADIVVLHGLDVLKSRIALSLPPHTTVAWRFFGYELYKNEELYLSEHSLMYQGRKWGMFSGVRDLLAQCKFYLRYGYLLHMLFSKAIQRADLFLGLSRHEHDYLTKLWGKLPPFVQIPLFDTVTDLSISKSQQYDKDDTILIGNNRSIYNNHLDILDLIEYSSLDTQWSFVIPFSYGTETPYSAAVRQFVTRSTRNFRLLEDFLEKHVYLDLVTRAKAAVFNSYRQMAMGNISMLLVNGVKIYLNSRNIIYHSFIESGLKVFTIEDLKSDLQSGNLELSVADRDSNMKAIQLLKDESSKEKFNHTLCLHIVSR